MKNTFKYIFDLRKKSESRYALKGALNIDLYHDIHMSNANFHNKFGLEKPSKSDFILVYCYNGMRSRKAEWYMRQNGYKNTFELPLGIRRYTFGTRKSLTK